MFWPTGQQFLHTLALKRSCGEAPAEDSEACQHPPSKQLPYMDCLPLSLAVHPQSEELVVGVAKRSFNIMATAQGPTQY